MLQRVTGGANERLHVIQVALERATPGYSDAILCLWMMILGNAW